MRLKWDRWHAYIEFSQSRKCHDGPNSVEPWTWIRLRMWHVTIDSMILRYARKT